MSRSSNLELSPTNSQKVLDSLDSISLPSEPPDVKKWFSSYVYESPELNTLDGFQVSDGCTETCLEKVVETKLGKSEYVLRREDDLVAGVEGSLDGIVKCNGSDELKHNNPAVGVSGLSESLSQCSEPPDIKNWFSSYVYESPPLDTTDNFSLFSHKEREDDRVINARKNSKGNDAKIITDVDQNRVMPNENNISAEVLKCTNLVEVAKQNDKLFCKVSELSDSLSQFSEPPDIKNWFLSYVYESPLLDTADFSIFSYKEREDDRVINARKPCKGNGKDVKTITDVEQNTLLPDESNISTVVFKCSNLVEDAKQDYKLVCKDGLDAELKRSSSALSQWTSENISEEMLPEQITHDQNQDSVEKFGKTNTDGNCRRSQIVRINGKENEEGALPENGFISTRKNKYTNNDNLRKQLSGVQSEVLRNVAQSASNSEKNRISRKALSETTNFHSMNAPEVIGKWRCPQRYKPNLGPPLKQLRLEQWVRRV